MYRLTGYKASERHDMISTHGRLGGAGVLVAAAAISLVACSSGSPSQHIASSGSSGSSASAQPTGNPSQLLDEWATCMRSHGYPTLADPTLDASEVIHITIPSGTTAGVAQTYQKSSAYGPCNPYLTAASTALRGGQRLQKPDPAKVVKFSQCMRANGIPDFPDPSGSGLQVRYSPGSDLNPKNPIFQNAQKKCANQVGEPQLAGGTLPPGFIMIQQQGDGGLGGGGGANG